MLERIASFAVRRRRLTLIVAVAIFLVSGGIGGSVAERLASGGFDNPASESFQADQALLDTFDTGVPNLVLLVTAGQPNEDVVAVDQPDAVAAGLALTEQLGAEPGLADVVSYWSLGNVPPLRSDGGNRALVFGRIVGDENTVNERVAELAEAYEGEFQGVEVEFSGFAHVFTTISHQIEEDLFRAEMIAFPITLLLLLFVFRGVVAALLPILIGALSVVSTFLILDLINRVTDVSVFALNMTISMGLGLSIDYALFVVSRYREELAAGFEHDTAIDRTVRTAGRTVAFSAGTVAASLLALLVFPLGFLKSFAYAGVAVGIMSGVYSVVVLPALMSALGPRVNALSIRSTRTEKATEDGAWYRIAKSVMRRPLPIATGVIALLVFAGVPFLGMELGLPDDRVLPEGHEGRHAADIIRDEFESAEAGAASVVALGIGDPLAPETLTEIDEYATRLSQLDHVTRVDAVSGIYFGGVRVLETNDFLTQRFARDDATYLSVVPDIEPNSLEGETFAKAVRAAPAPFDVQVTGQSAQLADARAALTGALPLALVIIAAITFALLFLLFGSVVVPLKALVLNVLSLTGTFGAMVWVFQEGNLSNLLRFDAVGTTDATTPILMFCVAFGLSMDYEVFLLSRIKEEYDQHGDNERAVAVGLEKTGRIVTAAAVLISVVFLAFGTSEVRFIKLFGIGLALAVLMDAFVIRGTLVPAFMRMAEKINWWAPEPMRRFHDRFGVSEHVELEPAPEPAAPVDVELVEDVPAEDAPPTTRPRRRRERPLVAAGRE